MMDFTNYEEYLEVLDNTHGFICYFNQYLKELIRKLAKLRDLGDDMVKSLNNFLSKSQDKAPNAQFDRKFRQLSQCLSIVEDNRDVKIERLESRLSKSFETLLECLKGTRVNLEENFFQNKIKPKFKIKYKRLISLYKKEAYQQYKYLNHDINHSDTNDMMDLKTELRKLIENFEKHKIQTFDTIFKEYVLIQLSFSSQASQVYTNAYKSLNSSVDEVFDKSLAEMTKGLYQHNFESTLIDVTNKFDQLNTTTKTNSPKSSKLTSDLSSSSLISFSSNSELINTNKEIKEIKSSNSIFGMVRLNEEESDEVLLNDNSTENSSDEEESYETKKRKARLDFLQSLTETEV